MKVVYTIYNGVIGSFEIIKETPKGYRVKAEGIKDGRQVMRSEAGYGGHTYDGYTYSTTDADEAIRIANQWLERNASRIKRVNDGIQSVKEGKQ